MSELGALDLQLAEYARHGACSGHAVPSQLVSTKTAATEPRATLEPAADGAYRRQMLARTFPRALPVFAVPLPMAACCKIVAASSRRQVDAKFAELDAQAARATPATRARIAVEA